METTLHSSPLLVADKQLSMGQATAAVQSLKAGAIVTFSGIVRDEENYTRISAITYEAYEQMAEKELEKIVLETKARWNVSTFVQHRIGTVPVGESSVIIACAGAHRKEAFLACEYMINKIKDHVPIWKVRFQ